MQPVALPANQLSSPTVYASQSTQVKLPCVPDKDLPLEHIAVRCDLTLLLFSFTATY